ncbi:MAG TPA: hypothetical protein VFF29_05655, partial [Bacteroidota bacterium]|nr:hypothetical protein [Bacteroidota bacterium]
MKNNLLWIIAVFVLGNCSNGLSQQDTAVQRDTIETEEILEALLEQSSEEEDSPILDILTSPLPQLSFSPKFNVRSRLYQRLQQSRGYENSEYLGSRISSYHRLLIRTNSNFSGGFLIDKDAGEPRVNDFTSGHLQFTTSGLINNVVVGDYIIEVGQGLALWRGFDFSKGAEVVSPVVKEGRGLIPYLSSGEAAFFRGAASRIISSPLDIIAFYSVRSRSGSIDSSNRITSLSTSGYFRTASERERKDNLNE